VYPDRSAAPGGHSIAYAWDTTEGHALLTGVQWNTFDASSTNAVTLDYETRPDEHRGYATGILETLSRRLHSVTVTHGGSLVRRYELSYGTGPYPALTTIELVGKSCETVKDAKDHKVAAQFPCGSIVPFKPPA